MGSFFRVKGERKDNSATAAIAAPVKLDVRKVITEPVPDFN